MCNNLLENIENDVVPIDTVIDKYFSFDFFFNASLASWNLTIEEVLELISRKPILGFTSPSL